LALPAEGVERYVAIRALGEGDNIGLPAVAKYKKPRKKK
jgi:hypothetical protein